MFLTVPKRFATPLLLPVALAGVLAVGCSRPTDGSTPPPGGAVIETVCAVYPATSDSLPYGASVPGFIPSVFGSGLDPVDCGCDGPDER